MEPKIPGHTVLAARHTCIHTPSNLSVLAYRGLYAWSPRYLDTQSLQQGTRAYTPLPTSVYLHIEAYMHGAQDTWTHSPCSKAHVHTHPFQPSVLAYRGLYAWSPRCMDPQSLQQGTCANTPLPTSVYLHIEAYMHGARDAWTHSPYSKALVQTQPFQQGVHAHTALSTRGTCAKKTYQKEVRPHTALPARVTCTSWDMQPMISIYLIPKLPRCECCSWVPLSGVLSGSSAGTARVLCELQPAAQWPPKFCYTQGWYDTLRSTKTAFYISSLQGKKQGHILLIILQ